MKNGNELNRTTDYRDWVSNSQNIKQIANQSCSVVGQASLYPESLCLTCAGKHTLPNTGSVSYNEWGMWKKLFIT